MFVIWCKTLIIFNVVPDDGEESGRNSEEAILDTSPTPKQSKQEDNSKSKEPPTTPKDSAKLGNGGLLAGTARLVKKPFDMFQDATKSTYNKFEDVDSDDLDKDTKKATSGITGDEERSPRRRREDSSSEGQDVSAGKRRDFDYVSLDDEFGSRPGKHTPSMESGEEEEQREDQEYDHRPPPKPRKSPRPPPAVVDNRPPQDVFMGHDKGSKCLIEDDELSDSEVSHSIDSVVSNPFKEPSSSRGSSVMSGISAPFGLSSPPTMSPQSDDAPQDAVFSKAPFLKGGSSMKKKKASSSSTPGSKVQKAASSLGDVFGNAPFVKRSWRSPPAQNPATTNDKNQEKTARTALFVNEAAMGGNQEGIYAAGMCNMAVQPMPSSPPAYQHISPQPSSLSPPLPSSTSQSPRDQQMDLFGSGNFSEMTFREAHVQMARQDRLAAAAAASNQPPRTTTSGAQRPHSQPALSLMAAPTQIPSPNSPQPPPQAPVQAPPPPQPQPRGSLSEAHMHLTASGGVRKSGRKPNGGSGATVLRRGSSGSSSGSSDKGNSPRSRHGRYSVPQDENVEILVGAGDGHHVKKQRGKAPPTTEFANLGFMDDLAAEEGEDEAGDGLHNLSMDALKPSNVANYMGSSAGSHTLPRSGSKKHKVKPRDVEPFTVSKSSSMYK